MKIAIIRLLLPLFLTVTLFVKDGWIFSSRSEFNLKFDTRNIYIIVSKCNENVSSLSEANINSGFGRKIEPRNFRIFFNFCFEMKERNIKF